MTEGPQKTCNLSIVIPLYNESHCIKNLELELSRFIETATHLQFEIILVNDGSTDSTGSHLNELKGNLENSYPNIPMIIKVIHLEMNIGKGGALRAGVLGSRGEWVLTLDADMATKFTQVLDWEKSRFIDLKIPSNTCKSVFIGSREHSESIVNDKLNRRLIGRCFNFFVQMINGLYTDDSQCGFKLYPQHIARNCFEKLREVGVGS